MHYLESIKPEFEFNISLKSILSTSFLGSYLPDPGESWAHVKQVWANDENDEPLVPGPDFYSTQGMKYEWI